jgi:hypothetical protein
MRIRSLRENISALIAPSTSRGFSRVGWIVTALLLLLLLSPILFFPLGPDESAFYIGGSKLLHGAVYYRDIIDVKPPLIHFIYAMALAASGGNGHAIMLLDLIVQGATCWLMIALIRRTTGNDLWGAIAAILYAILYVGLNFQNVAQPESWTGLLGLGMLRLMLTRRTRAGFLAIGAIGGVLFLLKFTLGIMLAAVLICEIILFKPDLRALVPRCVAMGAGLLAIAALLPIYILAHGLGHEIALMRGFTAGYARLQWGSPAEGIKNMLKMIAQQFGELYSMAMIGATAAGVAASIPSAAERDGEASGTRLVLRVATISFALLLATVCLEGRYYPYQLGRIYPFGAILAAYGVIAGLRWMLARRRGIYGKLLIVAALAGAILYGPLIRYGWWSIPMALRITRGEAGFDSYYGRLLDGLSRTELKSVAAFVNARRAPGDRIFAASNVAGMLYHHLGYIPETPILFSPSITAGFAPEEWRASVSGYLLAERPRFIITQRGDERPDQTGSAESSEQALRSLPGIGTMIDSAYVPVMHSDVFRVYQRREE